MTLSENAKEWIKDIAVAALVAAAFLFFIQPTIVKEHSMENTLSENDYLFVSRRAYKLFGVPKRGDIIVFDSGLPLSHGKTKQLIKRIIALPGDTVAVKNGKVVLNGSPLSENYTKDGCTLSPFDEMTVPEGCLFVMGDNRQNSADSRDPRIGPVSMEKVMGKAVFRLFPFSRMGGLCPSEDPSDASK